MKKLKNTSSAQLWCHVFAQKVEDCTRLCRGCKQDGTALSELMSFNLVTYFFNYEKKMEIQKVFFRPNQHFFSCSPSCVLTTNRNKINI